MSINVPHNKASGEIYIPVAADAVVHYHDIFKSKPSHPDVVQRSITSLARHPG